MIWPFLTFFGTLSSCHLVILSSLHLIILPFCHFVILAACQFASSLAFQIAHLGACEIVLHIRSMISFGGFLAECLPCLIFETLPEIIYQSFKNRHNNCLTGLGKNFTFSRQTNPFHWSSILVHTNCINCIFETLSKIIYQSVNNRPNNCLTGLRKTITFPHQSDPFHRSSILVFTNCISLLFWTLIFHAYSF